MKILNLVQGSDEWLAARLNYACASEAPVIMNASKFMTRRQLLDAKRGWKKNPDSSFKKRLFSKGHEHEDVARHFLELERCECFPPVVGMLEDYGNNPFNFLASFDGLGDDTGTIWEHKDWNLVLAENVRNEILEPLYYWQLEHQMLVANASEVAFTCSDGTLKNRVTMMYQSVPERREQLILGWQQFYRDLESHEVEAKVEVIVAEKTAMPGVIFEVSGTDIETNISDVLDTVKQLSQEEMERVLESDLDFANKEQLNKDVKKARDALKATTTDLRGQFVSYSEFETVAAQLDEVLQKMQSHGEKQVKQAKEKKKAKIIQVGIDGIARVVAEHNKKISPVMIQELVNVNPDFVAAVKGKRNIESLQSAVDAVVGNVITSIQIVAKTVEINLVYLRENTAGYEFLFNDYLTIINQAPEAFAAVVKMRIHEYQEAEKKRLDEERERIRIEEEAKAEAKVKADKEEADRKAKEADAEASLRRLKSHHHAKEQHKQAEEALKKPAQLAVDMASEVDSTASMIIEPAGKDSAVKWSSLPSSLICELDRFSENHGLSLQAMGELEEILNRHFHE